MEQIEIIKRDGTVIKCFSPEPFCTPTQAVQETSLMSDDTVKITLRTTQPYQFGRGDKVVINGYTYKIRTTPERQLQTEEDYIHTLTFYGVMYDLMKCQYRNCDANGNSTKAIFDLTYSIKDFVRVAIYNLNRDNPGEWAFDEQNCPDTEPITVSFSKSNVLQVIQDLCSKDKFNLEFRITTANGVNTIHIGQFGEVVTPPSGADYFEYGKGNGLWQLKEKKVDDKAIITRLWAEGGTQNIKNKYRDYSDRLQLPYPQRVNRNRHVLKDGTVIEAGTQTIGVADDSKRYLEDVAMSQVIGVEEDTQTFDDVYPKRTGTVTALGGSVLEFVDNTMDFDLNEKDSEGTRYLIDGTSAKLTFITGKLAGQEFELSKYDHTTKTFKLIAYTDERGLKIPTEDTDAFRFVVGDKYKLTDINMPDSYVQNAEEDLWYKALEYFNEAKQARCQYELTFDREYFLENMPGDSDTCLFKVGDYVPVKDTRFGIEKNIRIQKVSRNLLLDHSYTLTLSDTTAISVVAQSVLDVIEHEKIIQINDLRNLAKAKRGWRTTEELRNMVYDADGYFDPENIKPNSIDTNMLTVGSKSQQFVLTGVILEANYGGNVNKFSASSGVLSHLTIQEDSVRSWNMATQEVTLSQAGGYYVFAKCSKTGTNGVWYVTQDQLKVENDTDPNNYYFQVGVIGSLGVGDRFRDFTTTYGFTRINGNTITTGRIVTSDGESYLDLEGNKFRIGNSNSSLAWNVDGTGKLVLRGTMVQAGNGDLEKIGVWCGAFDPDRWYCLGDEVSYTVYGQTATFRYRYSTKTKGHLPTDTTYWEVTGSGVPGENGYSQAMVRLYKRDASKPSIDWSSTLTYTFATDTLSPIPSGWSRGVPANNGQALYITLASAVSRTATDTIAPNEFSEPVELVEDGRDGADGLDGADGVNGQDGTSIVWKGTFASAPANPQNGWAYYNSSTKKSYVYQDGSWYQMTVDGTDGQDGSDGLSIVWKGERSTPPSNPVKNWCYKDTDNGRVYIYDGSAWVLMVLDGSDGQDGADGSDGLSVFITYHDNALDNIPSVPTGSGITGGWHTNATSSAKWMSQKVAASADSGTWGNPIPIKGGDGQDGMNAATVFLYKRSPSTPSKPTSALTYTFATGILSGTLSGWTQNVPGTNGYPCYVIQATAVSSGATDTIAATEWSEVQVLVEDGQDGQDGITKVTVYTNSTSKPTTPTGSSVPPAGWRLEKQAPASTLSVTSIAKASEEAYSHFDLAQVNDTYRIKCLDPDYLNNFKGYVQINFSTTSANEKIVISMRASCEVYYDNGFVTALDNTTEPSRSTASSYVKIVSGDGVCELATISVPTAGNHFVRVWYIKDASRNKYDDAIYFNVITFGGGKLWQSIGSVRGDTAIFWTEPTEYAQDSAITYQGEYQPNKMYYGNSARRDVVKFQAQYYLANLTAGSFVNVLPTNADFWTPFGTQWESVATDLLLANLANIGGLIFKDNCLISQKGTINGVESTDYTNPDFLPLLFLDGVNGQSVIQGSMRSPFGRFDESWRWDDDEALLSSDKLDNLYAPFGGYDLPFTWSYKNSGRRLTIVHNNNGVATDYSSNVLRAPVGQYFFEDGLSKTSLSFCNEILELLGYGVGNTFFGWIVLDRHDILTNKRYGHKIVSLAMGRVTGTSSYARFKYITVFDGTHGSNTSSVTTRDNKKFSIARLDEGKYRMIIPSGWVGSTTDLLVMATGEGYSYGGDSSPVKASVVIESTTSILINVSDDRSRNDGDFNFMIMNMNHWLAL